ncbi:hypothetical protein PoB_001325300 [Plakobranchus ocellatus]|uniref:Uncharacterized protein n=1 Tax=Plakobranchus ocellatus TaxID=259542 RepID=A0AAV3YW27_9GAST|nr:hypothetical protein PoB_001325300 [Plakobranchus ocellatus]
MVQFFMPESLSSLVLVIENSPQVVVVEPHLNSHSRQLASGFEGGSGKGGGGGGVVEGEGFSPRGGHEIVRSNNIFGPSKKQTRDAVRGVAWYRKNYDEDALEEEDEEAGQRFYLAPISRNLFP